VQRTFHNPSFFKDTFSMSANPSDGDKNVPGRSRYKLKDSALLSACPDAVLHRKSPDAFDSESPPKIKFWSVAGFTQAFW
jgi:hypothetical protein